MKSRLMILFFVSYSLSVYAQQLVLPGDYPDPSVIKIGDTYWATATTSNWAPAYPILKSKDLVNWTTEAHVFNQLPEWVDYYFWAPEISYENGKIYIYYSAHKKGGNLCVGIASADKPEGPYRDHGPIICQEVGSIDAFPMRDENGKLYMIWKEDANSVNLPTPNWIQELNEDRTALIGERKEIFRNDKPWEANLIEGLSVIKRNEWYYAFYAAAGCCGRGCTYANGVARSKSLHGPWEKYEKNPVLVGDEKWKCPGHGTPIEKDGRYYFMYHAYDRSGDVYVGRQGLIMEYRFTEDDWIEFIKDDNAKDVAPPGFIKDDFQDGHLNQWQWSVFQNPDRKLRRGKLELGALPTATGAFLGQKTYTLNYDVTTTVQTNKSKAQTGITIIGDERNVIKAVIDYGSIKVIRVKDDIDSTISSQPVAIKNKTQLRMLVRNGKDVTFQYSLNRRDFITLNETPVDGTYLPPWDRAVRAGLIAKGTAGSKGVFRDFIMINRLNR
ncbi:MAG: family 43 glycosylhydrolase [Chitinophagaceae bacterium]